MGSNRQSIPDSDPLLSITIVPDELVLANFLRRSSTSFFTIVATDGSCFTKKEDATGALSKVSSSSSSYSSSSSSFGSVCAFLRRLFRASGSNSLAIILGAAPSALLMYKFARDPSERRFLHLNLYFPRRNAVGPPPKADADADW